MVDFKDLAAQYVLSDDESVMEQASLQAAVAIQNAAKDPAITRGVTANWVQSVNDWYPGSSTVPDIDDGEEAGSADVILRAKALGFLAATLEALPKGVLNGTQVQLLVHFFSVMFDADHKAGILAATKALRYLISMNAFKPQLADTVVGNIVKMGDDFRLQPPSTRFEVYELLHGLIQDPITRGELQHIHGSASGFVLDLLKMCQHERDPKNLLEWFAILKSLLRHYSMSHEVLQEVFKSFSSYFPISIRSSATPAAITTEQLKLAVRECFAADYRLADLSFPFLIQKLDQGDSVTVGVKLDILSTIKACVEQYSHAQKGIVPFVDKIWNSLKYEVRNGEIQATIQATLDVMSAISRKFAKLPHQDTQFEELQGFVNVVLGDCIDDFANPTYTKNAGQLASAVLASDIRAFTLTTPRLIDSLRNNIRQPKSPQHTRDLLGLLNTVLKARQAIIVNMGSSEASFATSPGFQVPENILDDIYVRLWRENTVEQPTTDQVTVLREVINGLALLIGQHAVSADGSVQRAYDDARCREICMTLSHRIVNSLLLSSASDTNATVDLERETVLALQKAITAYPSGFGVIVTQSMKTIRSRDWRGTPSQRSIKALTELSRRLAFVGCSEIPSGPAPLLNFVCLTGAWLQTLQIWFRSRVGFEITIIALQGILAAMLNFKDACSENSVDNKAADLTTLTKETLNQEVIAALPGFPRIDEDAETSFEADDINSSIQFGHKSRNARQDYLKLSLYICSQLYRRSTRLANIQDTGVSTLGLSGDFASKHASELDAEDAYLYQLGGMATFLIKDLSGPQQESLGLQDDVFKLFRTEGVQQSWSDADQGRANVLSMGVLRALQPAVVSKLPGGALSNILGDPESIRCLHDRSQIVRDGMACVIANKYHNKDSDGENVSWAEVITSLTTMLEPTHIKGCLPEVFSRALFVVAGAIARRDPSIGSLSSAIAHAPVESANCKAELGRIMEVLVSNKDFLSRETHAVIKPTYRQWVYHSIVQPILRLAYPFQPASDTSTTYSITVLSIVKHLVFDIYSADAEDIARIAIAGLSSLKNQYDLEATCLILLAVLDQNPEILKGHIKTIVDGAYGLYTTSTNSQTIAQGQPQIPARFLRTGSPSKCRKGAMKILELLPQKFDTGLLLPYAANLRRGLKIASGDSVRYIRPDVQAARKAWDSVV